MKVTEKQSRALQIILGILGAACIMLSLAAPFLLHIPDNQIQNSIWGWLWIGLFAVIMITQRALEKKFETRFVFFFRAYLFSLIAGVAVFVVYALSNHISFFAS